MNDLITAATSGLFVEVGKVIEHMKAQQSRIADLERQLAEASAPAVGRQQWSHVTPRDFVEVATAIMDQHGLMDGRSYEKTEKLCEAMEESFKKLPHPAPQAADTDKVREALPELPMHIHTHPVLGKLYDRIAMHCYGVKCMDMAAQAPVREVPGWISIKDQLPDDKQLVWCTRYDGRVHLARRHGNKPLATGEPSYNCYWWDEETGNNWSDVTVSAWMPVAERIRPLPAAPVLQEGE